MSTAGRHILIIEDNKYHAELVQTILKNKLNAEITWTDNSEGAVQELGKNIFQCILMDYYIPGMNGLELLRQARSINPEVPVIMITGMGNEELAAQAIKMGAYDYIPKGHDLFGFYKISHTVEKAIENYELKEALKKTEARYQAILKDSPLPQIEYGTSGDLIIKDTSATQDVPPPEIIAYSDDHAQRIFYERNLLNTIISTTNVLIMVFDMRGNTIVWNQMAERLTGYSQEDMNTIDKVFRRLYPEYKDRVQALELQNATLNAKTPGGNFQSFIHTDDERLKAISWTTSTVKDQYNKTAFIISAGIDVSQTKEIADEREAALYALKQRVKEISALYNIRRAEEECSGLDDFLETIIKNVVGSMQYPEIAHVKITLGSRALKDSAFHSSKHFLRRRFALGTSGTGSITVFYEEHRLFTEDESMMLANVAETISRYIRKQELERRVRDIEKYLESIFNAQGDMLSVHDLDYNIIAHNQAFAKAFEQAGQLPKCHQVLFAREEPCENCIMKAALEKKREVEDERFLEATSRWIHREAYPHLDETQEIKSVIIVTRDITEKKTMQEHLRRLDKLVSMGQLAAGFAHEIKNPLGGISSLTQILIEESAESSRQRELLQDMMWGISRINNIVQKTLDFSKPKKPQFILGAIADPMNTAIKLLEGKAHSRGIKFIRQVAPSIPHFFYDREKIEEMFFNLIINAIDAMPEPGNITIECALRSPIAEWEKYDQDPAARNLYISIADEGIGIPVPEREKIFEPFFTKKRTLGTGLGLSITHAIIEEHQGEITLHSQEGRGTTFYIRLPLRNKEIEISTTQNDLGWSVFKGTYGI